MMTSLDGYFEGPNHELDWHNVDSEFNDFAITQLDTIETLIFGRKTYDVMASYWPTPHALKDDPIVAEKMNSIPKIVFSRTTDKAEWNNSRLLNMIIPEDIQAMKQKAKKDIAIFGSSNLCVSFMEKGLLDEIRIMVNPTVLGKGNILFNGIKEKLNLKLTTTQIFKNGNALLTYSIIKQ